MNNQPNNTHTVLYTRVSTSEQATTGFSLRDQEDRLRHYCRQKGIKVVAHFEEDHSAKTFDRPEWKKLMRYLEANHGEIDLVLVVRWDRFSRDFTDASQMIRRLDEDFGVMAQAIEQPIDHDVPEQLPMLALYLATPEAENRRRSINTKKGMRRAMKEGRW